MCVKIFVVIPSEVSLCSLSSAEEEEQQKSESRGDTEQLLPASSPTSHKHRLSRRHDDSDSGDSISVYESKNL